MYCSRPSTLKKSPSIVKDRTSPCPNQHLKTGAKANGTSPYPALTPPAATQAPSHVPVQAAKASYFSIRLKLTSSTLPTNICPAILHRTLLRNQAAPLVKPNKTQMSEMYSSETLMGNSSDSVASLADIVNLFDMDGVPVLVVEEL